MPLETASLLKVLEKHRGLRQDLPLELSLKEYENKTKKAHALLLAVVNFSPH